MTRKEQTGTRDLTISAWIRKNLPDSSTGFMVSDLDFILWNWKTMKLMLIETKSRGVDMRPWQRNLFKALDGIIRLGVKYYRDDNRNQIEYLGFHCIIFENTSFEDGRCVFDGKQVSEHELIKKLSME